MLTKSVMFRVRRLAAIITAVRKAMTIRFGRSTPSAPQPPHHEIHRAARFWPVEAWEPGSTPPSFDKQPVRDFLDGLDWDKSPPPPTLPDEVVAASSARYREAYERITGRSLADWPGTGGDVGR